MEALADRNVPCGTCTLCCHQMVVIHPEHGDDPADYVTIRGVHPLTGQPALLLPMVDGACYYLREGKCATYTNRPAMCRHYDCGEDYRTHDRAERRRRIKAGTASPALYERGREIEEIRKRGGE